MTTHLIEYDDVAWLGFNIGYLQRLPEYIEAFKIKLGLVPPAEYGKRHEPALNQTVALARQGSPLWSSNATGIRSLHEATRRTLAEVLDLMQGTPSKDRVTQVTAQLRLHAAQFKRQQQECDRIIECAVKVIPRLMDFMNLRTFEYAKRKGLLIKGARSTVPETLGTALTDEQSLVSARSTIGWHQRAFSTTILSAGNMGAYCARLSSLLETTISQLNELKQGQSPRRVSVSCQSATSSAREAQRLINHTFNLILHFKF